MGEEDQEQFLFSLQDIGSFEGTVHLSFSLQVVIILVIMCDSPPKSSLPKSRVAKEFLLLFCQEKYKANRSFSW